jgi:hypothetical protein
MKPLITVLPLTGLLITGCASRKEVVNQLDLPRKEITTEPATVAATAQQTDNDCGIASLEHAALIWDVDILSTITDADRAKSSSLNSLAELARRNGFEAFVLQAGSETLDPLTEITKHLKAERPLVLLMRFPNSIGSMVNYVKNASSNEKYIGEPEKWHRHFVVLTTCRDISPAGKASYFTVMDPARAGFREVDIRWLDLFWIRQEAKYLLISK